MIEDRSACADCGHDVKSLGEYYMLTDELWMEAIAGDWAAMLCVGCVEARIGRRLVAADFITCPLNAGLWIHQSLRMRSRLMEAAG